jgi:flagellar basal body rod protein FlgG
MILGQRAYEANSRVVRTADQMLGEVNQLAR